MSKGVKEMRAETTRISGRKSIASREKSKYKEHKAWSWQGMGTEGKVIETDVKDFMRSKRSYKDGGFFSVVESHGEF